MDKIDSILYKYAAEGNDTKDKVYGASFVITDRNGENLLLHMSASLQEKIKR